MAITTIAMGKAQAAALLDAGSGAGPGFRGGGSVDMNLFHSRSLVREGQTFAA
jgi:hypothetical protein